MSSPENERLTDAILRTDFYSFLRASFPLVSQSSRFLPNWHIEAMTYALEQVATGEIKRLIIVLPARNLKSLCSSVAFPAFALGRDPTRCILRQLFRSAGAEARE